MLGLTTSASAQTQQVLLVKPGQPPGNTGLLTWNNAVGTFEEAASLVIPSQNTAILLAEGTYQPQIPTNGSITDRSFVFDPSWTNVRVIGGYLGTTGGSINPMAPDGNPVGTILDGSATATAPACLHVVTFANASGSQNMNELSLERCIVQAGRATNPNVPNGGVGGGVFITSEARVTLRSVAIGNNWADDGQISQGGGLYVSQNAGDPPFDKTGTILSSCVIRGNHANEGAGIYFNQGTVFKAGNTGLSFNGRIYPTGRPAGAPPECLDGGAVYLNSMTFSDWSNCLVTDNAARTRGGGFFWNPQTGSSQVMLHHTMTQCTVTLNAVLGDGVAPPFSAATTRGAGLHFAPAAQQAFNLKTFDVSNSIVYGNRTGADAAVFGTASANGARLIFNYSDIGSTQTPGVPAGASPPAGIEIKATCISQDPLFVSVPARNFRLQLTASGPFSPCIDTGDNGLIGLDIADVDLDFDFVEVLPIDYDGSPRILSSGSPTVDMGVYER